VPLIPDLLAFDLSQIDPAAPRSIDGLLAQDFFRGPVVQIDFRKKPVRLSSGLTRWLRGAAD